MNLEWPVSTVFIKKHLPKRNNKAVFLNADHQDPEIHPGMELPKVGTINEEQAHHRAI